MTQAQDKDRIQVAEGFATSKKAGDFTVEQICALREESAKGGEDVKARLQEITDILQEVCHFGLA
jgi:hypothetical protein